MKKKRLTPKKTSFLKVFIHKPLFFLVLLLFLPFLVWGIGQTQKLSSLGQNLKIQAGPDLCPTSSSQTYSSLRLNPNKPNRMNFDPAKNPETNLYMRGWYEVNESRELVSRHGDNYGLDPNMPPQISTLFKTHYPKIIKTYRVNAWDYENNHHLPGESATPNFAVHMLGVEATAGEPLVGLKAGSFLVRYATKNYILMTNGNEDAWDNDDDGGYPFYFIDICVDPNLLATYEADNAGGRNELPTISEGQIFGYAMTSEVKFVIRDTFSFMDSRYKEDWWEYGGFKPVFSQQPTAIIFPTQPPASPPPQPSLTNPTVPTTTPTVWQPTPTLTHTISPTIYNPPRATTAPLPSPTIIPSPSRSPTPAPLVDFKKTIDGAKSIWNKLITSFVQFSKVILP